MVIIILIVSAWCNGVKRVVNTRVIITTIACFTTQYIASIGSEN